MKEKITVPILYTDRLILNDITESDAPFIVELRGDPAVYRYFISPHKITMDEHLNWYKNKYVYDCNRFDWIAFDDKNEPIGLFGVKRDCETSDIAELSYILSMKHYGNGYAEEAVERLITFCKDEWKCRKVIAEIHNENSASIRFIKRLSFVPEAKKGEFVIYGKDI